MAKGEVRPEALELMGTSALEYLEQRDKWSLSDLLSQMDRGLAGKEYLEAFKNGMVTMLDMIVAGEVMNLEYAFRQPMVLTLVDNLRNSPLFYSGFMQGMAHLVAFLQIAQKEAGTGQKSWSDWLYSKAVRVRQEIVLGVVK